ncbi:hypothetical protein TRAPUB_1493 [Trametes pubescens]|uniref:Uncharacterized protein n=1 Tax=Trametes pubescens TaxID=154538 RepID=A0A1M2VJB9_TRAPU|nr:hypothetical protein TRAPUB_1493 [Trametes pubescens]
MGPYAPRLCTRTVSFASPYLANSGPGDAGLCVKIFFIWGSTTAICSLFALLSVLEVKGLALEQIDELYQDSTPLTSARYGRTFIVQGRTRNAARRLMGSEEGGTAELDEKEKGGALDGSVSSVVASLR